MRARLLVASIAMVFGGLGIGLGSQTASAYTLLPCHYDTSDLFYNFHDVLQRHQDRTIEAEALWDNSAAPVTVEEVGELADAKVNIYDGSYAWSDWANTSGGCPVGGGTWASNEVDLKLNTRTMDQAAFTLKQTRFVIVHEFGHAFGLDHNEKACGISIMRSEACVYSSQTGPPWSDDIAGINYLY